MRRLLTLGIALGLTFAVTAPAQALSVDRVIAQNLEAPWGLAFLPDGSALVSERDSARILRVDPTKPAGSNVTTVTRVAGVRAEGEGGLLGLALSPDSRELFAYVTTSRDNRVVRFPVRQTSAGVTLGKPTPILTGIPRAMFHNGGRLLMTPNGTLFVATGDARDPELSQDPTSLAGKVLAIDRNGKPASINPDPRSPMFTLGHRNVQGLAVDARNRVWASEFGEKDVDELNLLTPGGNYGWPVCEGACANRAYRNPAAQWSPTATASPSGIAAVANSIYVASLRGEKLWQVTNGKKKAVDVGDLGRLRTVATAPGGGLWLVTSNTDGRGDPSRTDDQIVLLR